MDLKSMTLEQLKAFVYDQMELREAAARNIEICRAEISSRQMTNADS